MYMLLCFVVFLFVSDDMPIYNNQLITQETDAEMHILKNGMVLSGKHTRKSIQAHKAFERKAAAMKIKLSTMKNQVYRDVMATNSIVIADDSPVQEQVHVQVSNTDRLYDDPNIDKSLKARINDLQLRFDYLKVHCFQQHWTTGLRKKITDSIVEMYNRSPQQKERWAAGEFPHFLLSRNNSFRKYKYFGIKCCTTCYHYVHGITKHHTTKFRGMLKRGEMGASGIYKGNHSKELHRKYKRATKKVSMDSITQRIHSWLGIFQVTACEEYPHRPGSFYTMYKMRKSDMFEQFRSAMVRECPDIPKDNWKVNTFRKIMCEFYQHIRSPRECQQGKCEDCRHIKDSLVHAKSHNKPLEIQKFELAKMNHMLLLWAEKKVYWTNMHQACFFPEANLSMTIDGLDKVKGALPYMKGLKTPSEMGARYECVVNGVHIHGNDVGPLIFVSDAKIPNDGNLTIHLLLKGLEKAKSIFAVKAAAGEWHGNRQTMLPDNLYLQLDNAPATNKNNLVFSFCSLLVERREFAQVYINFMPVGHTHNELDGAFGVLTKQLNLKPVYCLSDLMNICGNFMSTASDNERRFWRKPEVEFIERVVDAREYLLPLSIPIHDFKFESFSFLIMLKQRRDETKLLVPHIFFKSRMSAPNWGPTHGEEMSVLKPCTLPRWQPFRPLDIKGLEKTATYIESRCPGPVASEWRQMIANERKRQEDSCQECIQYSMKIREFLTSSKFSEDLNKKNKAQSNHWRSLLDEHRKTCKYAEIVDHPFWSGNSVPISSCGSRFEPTGIKAITLAQPSYRQTSSGSKLYPIMVSESWHTLALGSLVIIQGDPQSICEPHASCVHPLKVGFVVELSNETFSIHRYGDSTDHNAFLSSYQGLFNQTSEGASVPVIEHYVIKNTTILYCNLRLTKTGSTIPLKVLKRIYRDVRNQWIPNDEGMFFFCFGFSLFCLYYHYYQN